jgi:hypothetical protein
MATPISSKRANSEKHLLAGALTDVLKALNDEMKPKIQ